MKFLERLFFRRPRILNQLHRVGLIDPTSQTNEEELSALERYATGAKRALEIGTYQGVSAGRIAEALAADGYLYCVDPWVAVNRKTDSNFVICQRHLRRTGVLGRIRILRGLSAEVESQIPAGLDFAFIDGDHSRSGLETDWKIVAPRIHPCGHVCLHDTVVPSAEPWRSFGSVEFFRDVISRNPEFELVDAVYSMTVLRRR